MKMYFAIRHYSKIILWKKPLKQNIHFGIPNQIFKMSSTQHKNTIPVGELCISKSLDDFKVQYTNRFTSLVIKCLFCNNVSLYINKITGKYIFFKRTINMFFKLKLKFFRLVYLYTLLEVRRLDNI